MVIDRPGIQGAAACRPGAPSISLSTGTFQLLPLARTLELAREAGFDGVELVVTPEVALRATGSLVRLVQASGIRVLSVHPHIMPVPIGGWRDPCEQLRLATELALEFPTCRAVVIHTPDLVHWSGREARSYLDALAQCLAIIGDRPLLLAVENEKETRVQHPARVLHEPEVLATFAEELGVGVTFDTGHAGTRGRDVLEALRVLRPHLANVHFNDLRLMPHWLERVVPGLAHALLFHHQLPGQGVLPLREVLQFLRTTAYEGLITLELSPVAVRLWHLGGLVRTLRSLVAWCRHTLEDTP